MTRCPPAGPPTCVSRVALEEIHVQFGPKCLDMCIRAGVRGALDWVVGGQRQHHGPTQPHYATSFNNSNHKTQTRLVGYIVSYTQFTMAAAAESPSPLPSEDVSPAAQARKTRTQKALKKAKRKFSFVSGIGSSGVRTDAGQREDVGFWKGLKNAKRRVSQQVRASASCGCFRATPFMRSRADFGQAWVRQRNRR